jgi:indolepyruvate ferredoxin oxidoreductase beta subunit
MPVITGAAKYPENILDKLKEEVDVTSLDALSLAIEAGNAKAANVVLIGVMAKNTSIPYEEWVETVRASVPPKFVDVNLKAFDLGYHL